MVPLEHPYQKGWKRHFVVREDIKKSPSAAFYSSLLEKINTVQYHPDKSFKVKKRVKGLRKRGKTWVERKQFLQEFSEWQWSHHRSTLTELEKSHFHLYEKTSKDGKTKCFVYRFNEPWRYILQVKPRIITKVKLMDTLLEQEIQLLDNRIENYHLQPGISKLTGGVYKYKSWQLNTNRGYRNQLYRNALTSFLEECEEKNNNKRDEHFKNKRTK